MASDLIANISSITIASSNPKDPTKRKRVNRSAKLKQCKLDARREQWLSHVKNKGIKEDSNGGGRTQGELLFAEKERGRSMGKLEIKRRGDEENEGPVNNYSDFESPSNSPTSQISSILGSNDIGMNFSGGSSSSSSAASSSGSSSAGCCSRSMSEEGEEDEERDDDCYDDWEAAAEALIATDHKYEEHDPGSDLPRENIENVPPENSQLKANNQPCSVTNVPKSKKESGVTLQRASAANFQAWRPDDVCRPPSLPNLSKQLSFPINSERHFGRGGKVWGCKVASLPTSCPICYEDLDYTDTSFLPCSCGFRLCLFCHKRILEEDGRCPGCRKQYEYNPNRVLGEAILDGGSLTFRLARSCSLVTRL